MRFKLSLLIIIGTASCFSVFGQIRDPTVGGRSGGHAVYGDIIIENSQAGSGRPVKIDLTLLTESRTVFARDSVFGNGRYRFNNVPGGIYEISAEVEGQEITRFRVDLTSPLVEDVRKDLSFELKSTGAPAPRTGGISAVDQYERNAANTAAFAKAASAVDVKHYDEGVALLQTIVKSDPKDFQAWTELGNVHFLQSRYPDAENDFLRAIDLRPKFFLALLNLGRVELAQQKYDVAVEVLSRAVKSRPESADANYFLGESYLQIKKGSLAVGYLNEALRLDPKGMVEVHLRLARLYDVAGMKDKAAAEYEEFLKKRPDYKDSKKLEDYISANKKP
ncbi:MAG: tetratricopeptide repeat protein [Pyrinomonadaceae bacterium]